MLRIGRLFFILLGLLLCFSMIKPVFCAEREETMEKTMEKAAQSEITEGMNQGDFAMLLIKELGAQGLLPAAATTQDGFALMEKLGVVPPGGWDENGKINKEQLCYMLNLSGEKCEAASFDELLERLKKRLAEILWNMGIRGVSPPVPHVISPATLGEGIS